MSAKSSPELLDERSSLSLYLGEFRTSFLLAARCLQKRSLKAPPNASRTIPEVQCFWTSPTTAAANPFTAPAARSDSDEEDPDTLDIPHDNSDDLLSSPVPPPPTRRRGSVLDDAIMRDMLASRVAPAEGQEDTEEVERMERIWSKKYRQALVRDANASWDAELTQAHDDISSASSPSGESGDALTRVQEEEYDSTGSGSSSGFPPTTAKSFPPPAHTRALMGSDMSARRSSMNRGAFGAGRLFAASELDAALAAMPAEEENEGATAITTTNTNTNTNASKAPPPFLRSGTRSGIRDDDAHSKTMVDSPANTGSLTSLLSSGHPSISEVPALAPATVATLTTSLKGGRARSKAPHNSTTHAKPRVRFAETVTMIPVDEDDEDASNDEAVDEDQTDDDAALDRYASGSGGDDERQKCDGLPLSGPRSSHSSSETLGIHAEPGTPQEPRQQQQPDEEPSSRLRHTKSLAVRKLTRAFKRAFTGTTKLNPAAAAAAAAAVHAT
ncbi:hypothetical protein DFJ77DRAFT_507644 [Powellomyces hirtus]|nr:hypothetical protein DFJ77DRAFT_507644 [Powellomyces hirtus]